MLVSFTLLLSEGFVEYSVLVSVAGLGCGRVVASLQAVVLVLQ